MSPIRSLLKSFERCFVRPVGRRLRRGFRRLLGDGDRLGHLEERLENLESLVRELAGLAYLRLDEEPKDTLSSRPPREAA